MGKSYAVAGDYAKHETAIVSEHARICDGAVIGPFCLIGQDVRIGKGTVIGDRVTVLGPCEIGPSNHIFTGAVIGSEPQDRSYSGEDTYLSIGPGNIIREYVTINRGTTSGGGITRVGRENMIMAYAHIGHDCRIGDRTTITNAAALGGHCRIDDNVVIGGMVGIHQHSSVGRLAMIGAMSKVTRDIPPFMMAFGNPARLVGVNAEGLRRAGVPGEVRDLIRQAYRLLARHGYSVAHAAEAIESMAPDCQEIAEVVEFIRASRRGIAI